VVSVRYKLNKVGWTPFQAQYLADLNAGLLARSQFASGRSCDRPTRSRFSVVFLGPRANVELVPKFHVALHASHAALPMVTLKFRPNVAPLMSA
jgi:hypothetical protein